MLLTDICRFVQLILLLSHFQSAPRVFLWDDKHWVASLHIFRRADIIQAATQWSVHHWYIQFFFTYMYLFNMNTTHYNSLPFRMFVNISGYKRAKRYQA